MSNRELRTLKLTSGVGPSSFAIQNSLLEFRVLFLDDSRMAAVRVYSMRTGDGSLPSLDARLSPAVEATAIEFPDPPGLA
jgi:hypothetical protein